MPIPLEQFVKLLKESEMLSAEVLENLISSAGEPKDSTELAKRIISQNVLTRFQAEQIALGQAKTLTLGNYILLAKIGQGGMGAVYKAQHRRMKRIVAIKMLPAHALEHSNAAARFQREVEAAAKLRHPNIVAADDADEANGVHFLVMEYVDGSDLSALVRRNGPFSVGDAVNYILQAARGLEFAHGEGIIHRDIKPGNLLLDKRGTVKILDMGLARIEGNVSQQAELTSPGAVMGTVDYMAPEQALNTKHADARSDIYSLGISLWSLLIGRAAYDGDTLMAKLLAHRYTPIPSLCSARNDVPTSLDAIFRKMVAKQPNDRHQTMSEVIAELVDCIRGEALPAGVFATHSAVPLKSAGPAVEHHAEIPKAVHRTRHSTSSDTIIEVEVTSPADEMTQISDCQTQSWPTNTPAAGAKTSRNREATVSPTQSGWRRRIPQITVSLIAVTGLLAMFLLATPKGSTPAMARLEIEVLDPTTVVEVRGNTTKVQAGHDSAIVLKPGETVLTVTRGEQSFKTKPFELRPGNDSRVKVELFGERLLVTMGGRVLGEQDVGAAKQSQAIVVATMPQLVEAGTAPESNPLKVGMANQPNDVASSAVKRSRLWGGYRKRAISFAHDVTRQLDQIAAGEFFQWMKASANPPMEIHNDEAARKLVDFNSPAFLQWMKEVDALTPEKQVDAVSQKLMELNPKFDGKVHHSVFGGAVFYFAFATDEVWDISPVRALGGLKYLRCDGADRIGLLTDLSPLKGMKLTMLTFNQTQVSDLSILSEIATLTDLQLTQTKVTDLHPLRELPLTDLACQGNRIVDLSPLKRMPVEVLFCDFLPERDGDVLRSISTLRKINGKSAAEFWKNVDAKQ